MKQHPNDSNDSSSKDVEGGIDDFQDPNPSILDGNQFINIPKSNMTIAFSACHRIPERSFHWKGRPIICYRCLGIDAGIILMFLLLVIGYFYPVLHPAFVLSMYIPNVLFYFIVFGLLTQLPFVIDGTVQVVTSYQSNNPLRLITGLIGGIGQFFLLFSLGSIIGLIFDWILSFF